ncbi:mitochondrial carrier [Pluteus cervinus]|uniref:Mitochondrial carrier n=1 Tax=Pluteus cervinus TaxID=181527 RepID=A0ACD3A2T3_9AGAR|nr:mitochondrial carrier [Pluteus cervinus]
MGWIPFTSIQFLLYELLRRQLSIQTGQQPSPAYEAAICGSISGGFAAAVTTPLDMLKTRVMLYLRVKPILRSRFVTIYRTEGLTALFARVIARTMWISAGGAVFLGAYEWSLYRIMGS